MKKEKSHFINVYQPLPTKTTQCNQHILPNLSSILHDRAAFLKQKKQQAIIHARKKSERKYMAYLMEHSKRPRRYLAAYDIYEVLDRKERGIEKQFLRKLVCLQKTDQNECKSNKLLSYTAVLLKDISKKKIEQNHLKSLNLGCLLKQIHKRYQNQGQGMFIRKARRNRDKDTQVNINNEEIENVRIFEFKKEQNLVIKLAQNSIDQKWLDESVYEQKQPSQKMNEEKQQNELKAELTALELKLVLSRQKYESVCQNLRGEIEKCRRKDCSSLKNISHNYSIVSTLQNKQAKYSRQLSLYDNSQDAQQKGILDFIEKHEQLQQQVDGIRATVEELLIMETNDPINPQLMAILKQVKNILSPTPLGYA